MNLKLLYPPTINNYYTIARNRKILSKKGRRYLSDSTFMLGPQFDKGFNREERLLVCIWVYPPDKRKRDLDNLPKSILDSLTNAGVYHDDSQIDELIIKRMEVVKNGKTEISIVSIT